MEKAIVFGPLIVFFGFFALMVILFLSLVVNLIFKSKNEEWQGEVVDKQFNTVEDSETGVEHDYYYLVVKTDSGQERKISLSREKWAKFEIGNKIKKPKGKLFPNKI
jgi:hypothetical protein